MKEVEILWIKNTEPIKLGDYAKNFGIDINTLSYYSKPFSTFPWLEGKVRNSILNDLEDEWNENRNESMSSFSAVKKGVYVITLANNIGIEYGGKVSQVLYIGRGTLKQRLSEHLKIWIPAITSSIYDFALNFWMAEVKRQKNINFFHEVEYDLLRRFKDEYKYFPLQNKIMGKKNNKDHNYGKGWDLPLSSNSKKLKNGWAIKPLGKNPWAIKLDK